MILTEEEAREKWCPEVRLTASDGEWHNNRPPGNAPDAIESYLCCASECMAWRWDNDFSSQTEEGHGGDITLRLKRLNGEPKRGYCGKAGRP